MGDEKASVRYAAALGLASIADKKSLYVLEDAVKDENPVVRKVAKMGIEAIKKKE
jgi:HEAT repeat protein